MHDGIIEIDDVLEGGDEDFFTSNEIQSDYFNLIEKLKNPNGIKEKILTLYTARPKKDRKIYLDATTLPLNIFLVNNADHAEGLSHDLGNNEIRDIWKVRVSNKYLTQTLDGKIKYYQVTKNNTPIISIDLIS